MKKTILICPDSFKGTLSAVEAAKAIRNGILASCPDWETILLPLGDGGEGTVACFAAGGERVSLRVTGPYGEPTEAGYILHREAGYAYVESAEACGLPLSSRRETGLATTYGVGELIRDASRRVSKIYLGLGGSATTDLGAGMAAALGFCFLNRAGERFVPTGDTLGEVCKIRRPAEKLPEIIALCDVTNPLLGEKGSAAVYGPQKGASPEEILRLEQNLRSLSGIIDPEGAEYPGAGAAGGMGYCVRSLFGGKLLRGIDAVAEAMELEKKIAEASLVITGEGSFDRQSLMGKVVGGVAARAKKAGTPVLVFCGRSEPVDSLREKGIFAVFPLSYYPCSLPTSGETSAALTALGKAVAALIETEQVNK